jgi:hypothetical protein
VGPISAAASSATGKAPRSAIASPLKNSEYFGCFSSQRDGHWPCAVVEERGGDAWKPTRRQIGSIGIELQYEAPGLSENSSDRQSVRNPVADTDSGQIWRWPIKDGLADGV